MKLAALALVSVCTLAHAKPSHAGEKLVCQSDEGGEIAIQLSKANVFGRTMDCLSSDFVGKDDGCAPIGGYALHEPTGDVEIVAVVKKPAQFAKHNGGIVGHTLTRETIRFTGGFNSPNVGYEEIWTFEVERKTGKARWTYQDKSLDYQCAPAPKR